MIRTDAVFKALSDPTRREILRLLRSGPRTSGEIAQAFNTAWPTISRHLAVLRNAELITMRRDRSTVLCELDTTVFQDTIEQLLTQVQPGGLDGKRRP